VTAVGPRRPLLLGAALGGIGVVGAAGVSMQLCFALGTVVWLLSLRHRMSLRWVFVIALLVRVPFLFADYHSNDVHRYLWEGRLVLAGLSPYEVAPHDDRAAHLRDATHARINHPEYATIYPPAAHGLFAACAATGLSPRGVRNTVLLLDLVVVILLLLWLRGTGRPPGHAALYAWCPLVVASAASGHYDAWMLVWLVAAGWAWDRGRAHAAAALLGVAILSKTVAVLMLPWLFLRRPKAGLVAVGVVALGYLPFWGDDVVSSLLAFGSDFAFNGSLFRLLEWFAPSSARGIAVGLLLFWTGAVALAQPRFAPAAALTLAGLLVVSPTVHFWYLTWVVVMLPAIGPRRWTWPLLAWTAAAVFSSESYRANYAGEPFVEHFWLTTVEYAIPALLAAWLLWRGWPRKPSLEPCPSAATPPPGSYAVVIPCRGEAANLRSLVPAWCATDAQRIVLADTPTGDGTEALADGERVVYAPVVRRGYGAAVQAGFLAAGGVDFLVVCDADHARGPDQIDALLGPLSDARVGLVSAARFNTASLTAPQRAGNALASLLIALGWGQRFHDLGPFRALRRAAWPAGALTDPGFGWNVEMNVRALELGLRVVEVPLPGSEREHGRNQISGTIRGVVRTGYGILRRLFTLREQSCRLPSSS